MTAPVDPTLRLVCGCIPGVAHADGCGLGVAERVALDAIAAAEEDAGGPLIVALVALSNAGLLEDLGAHDHDRLMGLLDTLWEMDLIPECVSTVDGGE